jgi:acetone carboxylase gamma subunit
MAAEQMKIGNVEHGPSGCSCAGCGGTLCGQGENWKEHVLAKRGNAADRLNQGQFGESYRVHENQHVELAELFCPHCHDLLSVELYLKDEPYRWDYRSLETAKEQGYDPVSEFHQDEDSWISF